MRTVAIMCVAIVQRGRACLDFVQEYDTKMKTDGEEGRLLRLFENYCLERRHAPRADGVLWGYYHSETKAIKVTPKHPLAHGAHAALLDWGGVPRTASGRGGRGRQDRNVIGILRRRRRHCTLGRLRGNGRTRCLVRARCWSGWPTGRECSSKRESPHNASRSVLASCGPVNTGSTGVADFVGCSVVLL